MLRTRQSLVVGTDAELDALIERIGVVSATLGGPTPDNSFVYAPLSIGEQAMGVIVLGKQPEHAFGPNDVNLITTVDASLSVALQNAQSFEAERQRNAELAVINSVQEGLVRELDMQAIYDLVGNRICTLFDIQVVVIRTFDHNAGLEHWQYAIEKGERQHVEPRPFIWANRELIRTRQPMLINENYVETARKFGGTGVTVGKSPKSAVFSPCSSVTPSKALLACRMSIAKMLSAIPTCGCSPRWPIA